MALRSISRVDTPCVSSHLRRGMESDSEVSRGKTGVRDSSGRYDGVIVWYRSEGLPCMGYFIPVRYG